MRSRSTRIEVESSYRADNYEHYHCKVHYCRASKFIVDLENSSWENNLTFDWVSSGEQRRFQLDRADTYLSTVYSFISLRFTLTTNQLFKLLWHLMISLQLSLGHFAAVCVCVCVVLRHDQTKKKKKLIRTGAVIWHIGKVPEHHMNQCMIIVLE